MGLQFYYAGISLYGWYYWLKGGKSARNASGEKAPVQRMPKKLIPGSIAVTVVIFLIILLILLQFTDSTVPFMDSMTTALSITATWMLAKKMIEHWLIWVFVDLVSAGLYAYKDLWPTVALFLVYTVMAMVGYSEWKKDLSVEK